MDGGQGAGCSHEGADSEGRWWGGHGASCAGSGWGGEEWAPAAEVLNAGGQG